jgi:hypothetical protein
MKVGDLVVFRRDTVPGLIVALRPTIAYPPRYERYCHGQVRDDRIGVLWSDVDVVTWEPMKYLRVINESR